MKARPNISADQTSKTAPSKNMAVVLQGNPGAVSV